MAEVTPPGRLQTAAIRTAYLTGSRLLAGVAPWLLRRRLARGREMPQRWREKLGFATLPRPEGRLFWLHAVGLGETLALRGLVAALASQAPDVQFLVTSGTRTSAEVLARDLPPNTRHQFLPLDSAPYLARFLDHWRPDLAIWSEQDIWPGAIFATAARGIPQALVNARISQRSFESRRRLRPLYRAVFDALALVDAQDAETARRLAALGAAGVTVSGSLKPAAPAMGAASAPLEDLRKILAGRRVWVAASSHPGDEAEALAALRATASDGSLLILAPRFVERAGEIAQALRDADLPFAQRSKDEVPGPQTLVWLADTYGELALWYRLADLALVGGGFDAVGGHNPWEAVHLGVGVLHGPDTANFRTDYDLLDQTGAARRLRPGELAQSLPPPEEARAMACRAEALVTQARDRVAGLAGRLLALTESPKCP